MFVTFEGIEGSGKSTLLRGMAEALAQRGLPSLSTREPGGCGLGLKLRDVLLHAESRLCSEAELFLFLADRAQHVSEIIRPALEAGQVVLCDRYADSTIVYQGYGRGLDPHRLRDLNDQAVGGLWPDLTLIIDLEVEQGLQRARSRNRELGLEAAEGRFEAEAFAFHQRIRNGFLHWAALAPERFVVLDGSLTPAALLAAALQAFDRCQHTFSPSR